MMLAADDLRVARFGSLAELGARMWDRLARHEGVYLGSSWVSWSEVGTAHRTTYLLLSDSDHRPLGAVVTFLRYGGQGLSLNRAYEPVELLVAPRREAVSDADRGALDPVLLVGSRAGYHGGLLVEPDLDPADRRAVLARLWREIHALAAELGAGCVALLYAPTGHAREVAAVGEAVGARPFVAPISAEAVMPVPDQDVSPTPRKRLREQHREERVFRDGGSTIERARLSACVDEITPLFGHLQRKYGEDDTDEALHAYLTGQAAHLDHCSHVLIERRSGVATGFALCYAWNDLLHVRAAGFGVDSGRYAYFVVVYHEAVRLARELGLTHVDLGTGAYEAKFRRGARARPTWALVAPLVKPPAPEWWSLLEQPGEDYLDALAIRCRTRPGR